MHRAGTTLVCLQQLCHCLLVTLARHYPGDFSPNMHASLVKFLNYVISALAPSSGQIGRVDAEGSCV